MMAKGREERSSYANSNANFEQSLENLHKCVNYCINEVDCRRVMLLEYFGEEFSREKCNATCDNCKRGGVISVRDFSDEARSIAAVVRDLEHVKGKRLNVTKLTQILSGSKSKDLENYREVIARHKPPVIPGDIIPRVINQMLIKGYLYEENQSNASGFSHEYLRVGKVETRPGEFLQVRFLRCNPMVSTI
jgi:bloom syndrome protein